MSLAQDLRAMESSVGIQRRHRYGTYFEGSLTVKRLQTVLLSKALRMHANLLDTTTTATATATTTTRRRRRTTRTRTRTSTRTRTRTRTATTGTATATATAKATSTRGNTRTMQRKGTRKKRQERRWRWWLQLCGGGQQATRLETEFIAGN